MTNRIFPCRETVNRLESMNTKLRCGFMMVLFIEQEKDRFYLYLIVRSKKPNSLPESEEFFVNTPIVMAIY